MSKAAFWLLTGLCVAAMAGSLDAKPRIRFGGLAVGSGFGWGGYPYPYFSPFYYDPFFFGFTPFYYPGYLTGYAWQPNMGEVKLHTSTNTGEVFLNGAYAGDVAKLKSMWLDAGAYNLEIRRNGQPVYERRIYVLTGKTLKIKAPEK